MLAAFEPGVAIDANALPPSESQCAQKIEQAFTGGVGFLKAIPNEKINHLANMIWSVFHHKYVSLCLGTQVATVTFAMLQRSPLEKNALVMIPNNWLSMIKEDPIMQLGAVLCCGSQSVDYYNDRFVIDTSNTIKQRANAYEAEFLKTIILTANQYQKAIIEKYPNGYDPKYDYQHKPVVGKN